MTNGRTDGPTHGLLELLREAKKKLKQGLGVGNQCKTPGVKFKEFTGIKRQNGMNLEETGIKRVEKKQKN